MAQIAQAYFHFHKELSAKQLRAFGRRLDREALRAARRNFDTPVLINVEVEEGSTFGRVTAIATVIGIYTGIISDYKGVKDSLKEMYSDARSFSGEVVSKAIEIAGVTEKQVYRVERRTKTVGKLTRFLADIQRLESSVDDLSPAQMRKELGRLSHELQAITRDLEPSDKKALRGALEHTKLPPPSKWPVPDMPPRAAINREQYEFDYQPLLEDRERRRPARPRLKYENSFRVEPTKRVERGPRLLPKSNQQ